MAINIDKLEQAIRLLQQVPGLEMRGFLTKDQKALLEHRLVDEIGEIITPEIPKTKPKPVEPEPTEEEVAAPVVSKYKKK